MKNLVLIGMPGCGKSTIGKLLANTLGRKFADTDAYITDETGRTIPDIFAENGESAFRKIETETLRKLGNQSSYVISTGGGCVTRPENYDLLHQNSTIIWLQRDLDLLPKDGRPLSQQKSLVDMYNIRKPLYEEFADYIVVNDTATQNVVNRIIQLINEGAVK